VETPALISTIVIAVIVVALIAFIARQNARMRLDMADRMNEINKQLLETTGRIDLRLDGANTTLSGVQQRLGELGEASKRIYDIGKDVASLQDVLKPPKMRGIMGETMLQEVLVQILPGNCEFQYGFKTGATVDAVIKLGGRLVPIDAKFPLENFRKALDAADENDRERHKRQFAADVRKHADAIAAKYILPEENTFDFALMYLPSETIYYEIIARDTAGEESPADYSVGKRVIPVSPNTIFAYLQTIMMGLRGLQVEAKAEEIVKLIGQVRSDLGRFAGDFDVLGGHINNAANRFADADKKLNRLNARMDMVDAIEEGSAVEEEA